MGGGLFNDLPDLLDPATPEGMLFIVGSGLLDDEDNRDEDADGDPCACWCGCRRRARWGDDDCPRCQVDRHLDDK